MCDLQEYLGFGLQKVTFLRIEAMKVDWVLVLLFFMGAVRPLVVYFWKKHH